MNGSPNTKDSFPGRFQTRRRYPPWLRWLLARWWGLIAFVLLALVGNILLVPLAQRPNHWWSAVISQVTVVYTLASTYPIPAVLIAAVVLLLTIVGYRENETLKREAHQTLVVETTSAHFNERMAELEQHLRAAVPAVPPGVATPTGLPRPSSLIGRDMDLTELMTQLRAGDTVGVFALEGMGGVGKTALAAEAVARLSEEHTTFPGGAAWISCEGLVEREGLAELWGRVAHALELNGIAAEADPEKRHVMLAHALAQRQRLLLALDNLEPDLDAEAVLNVLAVHGHTTILLTARQAVAPERLITIVLHPLEQPDAEVLFMQRLTQRDPSRPTTEDRQLIPTLVEEVGGLPLAIELTAAYAGVQRLRLNLVLQEVRSDLLDTMALRGPRDSKRGLRQCFDRSWQVLTPNQQQLFAGLSSLQGASFPRAAAAALARAINSEGDVSEIRGDLESDVAALVSYALVEPLAEGRLRLHPLLRKYAGECLQAQPRVKADWLGGVTVTFWLQYAKTHSGYNERKMDALEDEAVGLMGALAWAYEHGHYHDVLALAHALRAAWYVRGRRDEQLRMYTWAAAAARHLGDRRGQRWATHELAVTQFRTGQLEQARAGYEQAFTVAHRLKDLDAERAELHGLAILDARTGKPEQARVRYERALTIARLLEDPCAERLELHGMAVLDARAGKLEEARSGYEQALAIARQLRDRRVERADLHGLAVLDTRAGRLAEAREGFQRALEIARQLKDPAVEALELQNFGAFIGQHGEPDQGRALLQESLKISRRLSNIQRIGKCYQFLAWLDRDDGNHTGAISNYHQALHYLEQVQSPVAEEARTDLRRLIAIDKDGKDN